MAGWDDVSSPVAAPPSNSWDAVSSAVSAKPLDTAPVKQMATRNLQQPKEGEGEEQKDETFGPKLDKAMGMPVTGALGKSDTDIQFSKPMRAHMMDAYASGTAHDAADYMQGAIPAASSVAAPQPSDVGYWGKVKEAYTTANKQAVATLVAPLLPKEMQQDLVDQGLLEPNFKFQDPAHPTGPEAVQAFTQGERSTVGRAAGLLYAPVASLVSPLINPAIQATPGVAEKVGASSEWAKTIPPVLGMAMDFLGFGAGHLSGHADLHPELQTVIGDKLGKPPEAVTQNDIASAIRMGFESKAPKAQDFKDTAAVVLGHEAEETGAATLREVYKETGVAPEKVFEDAKIDPTIVADLKEGKIPAAYEDLIEKEEETAKPEETAPEKPTEPANPPDEALAPENEKTPPVKPSDLSSEHQEIEDKFGAPEEMNGPQLGKLDKKLQAIFSNQEQKGLPKAADLSDEQFNAMEEYARRVEAAQASAKNAKPAEQIRNVFKDEAGSVSVPQEAKDFGNEIKRDILNFATPMATGSERAQAAAKDFANGLRFTQWNGARVTNMLQEKFTPEQLQGMWKAMDESSVHAQRLEAGGLSREEALAQTEKDNVGHFALPEEQREVIKALSEWAEHAWDQAKHLEMVKGEGLPFWTPRMAAVIGEDGQWHAPGQGEGKPSLDIGSNLKTTSGNLKGRKYLTAEETEAAMKEHFGDENGEGAMLVKDIRAMPLAITRLQQAIAGRSLVNEIKEMGKNTGIDTTSSSPGEGYFTLDHPALKTFTPRLKLNDDGKWEMVKDEDGNNIFDKVPVYVSKEFEGPLKAVLSQKSGPTYRALMDFKGKSMGLIMYSPLIHNAVEWGRALPAMPGKVATFKIYFEGNKLKNDPEQMQEAINAGLVPIGNRFFNQDISSIIEQPNLTPGRSWTAKLLGNLTDQVSPKGGEKVRAAIDKFGDIWHNTLLWDRVADLQAGIYGNIRDSAMKDGMEPQAAQSYAAHVANRFAGALPAESMGKLATKMANIAMFSRSFTIGNLGVMKDMLTGLPSDVMAQLKRDVGEEGAKQAAKAGQRKAIAAFALDIGLMYAGNSILQDTFDYLKRDKGLGQIAQGYVDRFHKLLSKHAESPWDLLNIPADLQALSSTSENEPGKENRILFSKDPKTGTAYYMRLPTGKIGEEFEGWLTSPLEMARKKTSQIAGPLIDTFKNEDHFGHPIYDKDARGLGGAAVNIGKVVTHLMEAQIPLDSVQSAYHLLTGSSQSTSLDAMKTFGPLGGVTFSKGYPGGPEAGVLAAASRRHEAQISEALPKVKEAVEKGDEEKAHQIMDDLRMNSREQRSIIRHYQDPQSKVNARSLRKFERIATPEEKEQLEEQQK